jgi:hypothetical protein
MSTPCAAEHDGYPGIGDGGWPGKALGWFMGREVFYGCPDEGMPDQRIREICSADRPAVTYGAFIPDDDPRATIAKEHNVWSNHSYAVKGVDENGHILVHNPCGSSFDPKPLPPAVFRQLTEHVAWCE